MKMAYADESRIVTVRRYGNHVRVEFDTGCTEFYPASFLLNRSDERGLAGLVRFVVERLF